MRIIKNLVVHCSATQAKADIGAKEIKAIHVKQNGWRDIGYHYVIRRNGDIERGRPIEQIGAHVAGYNANSIGICLIGGIDAKGKAENNFTPEQFNSLKSLLADLKAKYPAANICGHRDFPNVAKDCPCFDVKSWWRKGQH